MPNKQRGLGRGLDALLSSDMDVDSAAVSEIGLEKIRPGNEQPRKNFDEASLQELAKSIKEHGVLQPVLVRPVGEYYGIVAGERRWRAAQIAGLATVPAVVKEMDDIQAAEISLVENLQRDDLTIIEEALAYKNMVQQYGYTQEAISARIGKSRSHVANCLRILALPVEIIDMLEQRKITAGHARALLALDNDIERVKAAREICNGKISVRETEKRVKVKKPGVPKDKSLEMMELEERLEKFFGTKTAIITRPKGGKIEISYYNGEDLERIIELLNL